MKNINNYEIIDEIKSFGQNITLWLAENNSGTEFEILTIKSNTEFEKKIERVIKNEINSIIDEQFEGIQKIIETGYSKENKVYFIVYENSQEDYEQIEDFNKQNLLCFIETLKLLKKQNRFGFFITPQTVLINSKNKILIKFIGLFEIFKSFNQLENKYLSSEIKEGKNPKLQDDIYAVGKLYFDYLSSKQLIDKILSENRKKNYKKYSEFITDIENISEPIKEITYRNSIKVETQQQFENDFEPILKEMNALCYWTIEPEKSKNENITGRFTTKNYSGRYFLDDDNYIFIPYSKNLNGENDYIRRNGKIADFNFVDYSVNFNCVTYFETEFEQKNKLALLNIKKQSLITKWQVLPEKEKEFIEEKAFKARFLEREESKSNNQNIRFKLKEEFKDWANIKELKTQKTKLFIDDNIIGEILDFNPKDNSIIIKDSKLSINEIPEIGEIIQDVRQETSQFKKQVEACKQFEARDIVNPAITGILATPEKTPTFNRVDLDYENFENLIVNDYLKNDESQKEAVLEALYKKPVYLIQGPPGTGKTTVIVELVQQLINNNSDCKILITSQSNLAVDNVLERLSEDILFMRLASEQVVERDNINSKIKPHLFSNKLKNWVEQTKESSEKYFKTKFGDKTKNKTLITFYNFYNNLPKRNEKELLTKFFDRLNMSHNYLKRLFENAKSKKEIDNIFEKELGSNYKKLIQLQKDWFAFISNSSSADGERKKSMLNNGSSEIDLLTAYAMSINVIGATCIHIASSAYRTIDFKFDFVIMDEASKASPAETLVPINMARNIILIGDHKQLPPVITRDNAVKQKIKDRLEDNGLDFDKEFGESLFERLITSFESNYNLSSYVKMLDIQYRMPRQVGNLISKNFYENKLKNPDVRLESLKNYDKEKFHSLKLTKPNVSIMDNYTEQEEIVPNSILFISTSNRDDPYDNDNKFDRKNLCNIKVIKEILDKIDQSYPNNSENEKPLNIGVIAGYRGQVELLKERIRISDYKNFNIKQENKTIPLIEINTVDKFQGAERDILIYDIVRSSKGKSNIGFLDDYRRINVALSRVKRLLIIVGDSNYIIKRATLNQYSKFGDFKLQNIVKDLREQGLIYNSINEAIDGKE
ncbi:AAA domain-containing protein [Labilibaculum sp. DW002]|uniref:AAA domain-containing protein n=1 Tax=Paralabilibaculum antarcticum TaxID=2912572 RepID=A0ABT5VSQ9_9BACT|nr:AAA domain-containing protein [Labilibaculum sp. DW002]MDE5418460.1 AAA domain-containing protein [Labilibaculum sp. DW002]